MNANDGVGAGENVCFSVNVVGERSRVDVDGTGATIGVYHHGPPSQTFYIRSTINELAEMQVNV